MKNMKFFSALLLLTNFCYLSMQAQDKYIDKKGTVVFEASEATFEPVKATNKSVTAILNTDNGEIASLALMKSFRFKNSLMEEHFNENYVESETYPKAIFRGKIVGFDASSISEKETEVVINGTMELHGKTKSIEAKFMISKQGETIFLKGSFYVSPEDFDIEIPSVVKNKIAKNIEVTLDFKMAEK